MQHFCEIVSFSMSVLRVKSGHVAFWSITYYLKERVIHNYIKVNERISRRVKHRLQVTTVKIELIPCTIRLHTPTIPTYRLSTENLMIFSFANVLMGTHLTTI